MTHFQASFIHGHVGLGFRSESDMDAMAGMVIECDAPSVVDAAEILFTSANKHQAIPSGVKVVEALHGLPMTVGDVAIILDMDSKLPTTLKCGIEGWQP